MRRKICGLILAISFFLIIGIMGGVDRGEPLSNAIWCFPLLFIGITSAKIGGFFEEVE